MFHKKALLPALCVSLCLCGAMIPDASAISYDKVPRQDAVAPYAIYIAKASCDLNFNGKTAVIMGRVTGQTGIVDRCRVVVYLQEKSGSEWKTVDTWTAEEDGQRASVSETKAVTAGKTYRAKVVVTAWSGSKSETKTISSPEKKA